MAGSGSLYRTTISTPSNKKVVVGPGSSGDSTRLSSTLPKTGTPGSKKRNRSQRKRHSLDSLVAKEMATTPLARLSGLGSVGPSTPATPLRHLGAGPPESSGGKLTPEDATVVPAPCDWREPPVSEGLGSSETPPMSLLESLERNSSKKKKKRRKQSVRAETQSDVRAQSLLPFLDNL